MLSDRFWLVWYGFHWRGAALAAAVSAMVPRTRAVNRAAAVLVVMAISYLFGSLIQRCPPDDVEIHRGRRKRNARTANAPSIGRERRVKRGSNTCERNRERA